VAPRPAGVRRLHVPPPGRPPAPRPAPGARRLHVPRSPSVDRPHARARRAGRPVAATWRPVPRCRGRTLTRDPVVGSPRPGGPSREAAGERSHATPSWARRDLEARDAGLRENAHTRPVVGSPRPRPRDAGPRERSHATPSWARRDLLAAAVAGVIIALSGPNVGSPRPRPRDAGPGRTLTRDLVVGCCADGRRGRARRITTGACANGARYLRHNHCQSWSRSLPRPHPARGRPRRVALAGGDRRRGLRPRRLPAERALDEHTTLRWTLSYGDVRC